jgi:type II secretory pathway component PulM
MSAIDNAQARLDAALAPIQSQLEPLLDSLSPRDRKLLMGLAAAACLALIAAAGWWMTSTLDGLREDIDERKDTLAFVRRSVAEFEANQARLEQIESELKRHSGTDLAAFLEKAAESAGIEERPGVRQSATTQLGSLEAKTFTVNLSRVTLDQFLDFLYQIETDGYPLRITDSSVKGVSRSESMMLNVKLDIVSYKLLDSEEEEG